jgi:tRNA A-37 threonylcarbamoyl transferase component Bud32/ABC-type branched-subunit amino acid transport system substrate-binding protein
MGDGPILEPGQSVGRYVVEGLLGEGAMGRVYAAYDPKLDRRVALKLLHASVADPHLEARLAREARAMARASHADVVTVFDAGRHGAQLFIAMELVDGGSLRQWLRAERRPWRTVLDVYLRAGAGLAQAHAAGLVHCDFKPDNVLVSRDGRARVTDFGLAREARLDVPTGGDAPSAEALALDATATGAGTLLGTPAYMAPEQLRGAPADARSDLYAFCVALYEGLYGERPFDETSMAALLAAKEQGRVRPAPPAADVPKGLRAAVVVGLRPRPADRYASMAALMAALERGARGSRARLVLGAAAVLGGAAGLALVLRAGRAATPGAPAALPAASAQAVAASAPCSLRECSAAHGGEPWVCRPSDRACVPVASEDCAAAYEPADLDSDDTVWLGAMFPTTGDDAEAFGRMNVEGAELAREEIARATAALDVATSRRVRRIGLVTCDDAADATRAAKHLVDDVNVPAILGFRSGQELVDLGGSLLLPRRVLAVASLTSSPLVTRLPQPADLPRMVWRTTFSIEEASTVTARLLHDVLEPRFARSPAMGGRVRVTLARLDMAAGLWFGEAFYERVVFNGRTGVQNGDAYQEVPVPPRGDLAPVVERVIASRPTFLVLLNQSAVTARLVEAVEARWPAGLPRPVYVVAEDSAAVLASFAGRDADRRRRVFGVMSLSNDPRNEGFVARWNASHARQVSLTFNPAVSYDAFYLLAYAAFALGEAPVDGPALGRAVGRLVPPGRPIEAGPEALAEGVSALLGGESIDLHGVETSLDFDLATGEQASDFELLCLGVDAAGRAASDVESGVYFRAASRAVEGTLACP